MAVSPKRGRFPFYAPSWVLDGCFRSDIWHQETFSDYWGVISHTHTYWYAPNEKRTTNLPSFFWYDLPTSRLQGGCFPKVTALQDRASDWIEKTLLSSNFFQQIIPRKTYFLLHPRNFSIIFNFFPRNLWVISPNDLPKISPTHSSPTCKALDQLHLVRWQMFRKLWTAARFFRVTKNLGGELTAVWIFVA